MNAAENKESMFTLTPQVYLLAYICIRWKIIHLQCRRPGFDPWVGKIPREGNGNSLQYFLQEFHGQRSLAGYSPWGSKELDTTEQLALSIYLCGNSGTSLYGNKSNNLRLSIPSMTNNWFVRLLFLIDSIIIVKYGLDIYQLMIKCWFIMLPLLTICP